MHDVHYLDQADARQRLADLRRAPGRGSVTVPIGGDATVEGNQDGRVYRAEPLLAIEFLRAGGVLELRAGLSRLGPGGALGEVRPYWGIGVYREF